MFHGLALVIASAARSLSLLLALAVLQAGTVVSAASLDEVRGLVEARDARALTAAQSFAAANAQSADAWALLARAQLAAGKNDQALASGEKAVSLDANNAQAQFWLGNSYGANIMSAGMLGKARMAPKLRDAFEKTVALDPNNLDARGALVEFYAQAPGIMGGSLEKARAQVAEIAKRDAALGHSARASVVLAGGDTNGAIKEYEAASRLKPTDPEIRLGMGLMYQRAERWDDAFRHFRAWTQEDPRATRAWYQLGRTAALSGTGTAEGAAAIAKYLALPRAPGDAEAQHAYYRLGQIHAKAGDKAAARAAFEQALKLDPKMKTAKEALAELK
jgi:tetratricopeptide (TPR) repeat protein